MDIEGLLEKLSSPAERAIRNLNIQTLEDFSRYTRKEIVSAHGIGNHAMRIIEEALESAHIRFRSER